MSIHDIIGDFLTSIRNASSVGKLNCSVPYSKLKLGIAKILHNEGYISNFKKKISSSGFDQIVIELKYNKNERAIVGIERFSKPGRRVYCRSRNIPYVLNGFGVIIISTSRGILSDKIARKEKIGGELIAKIW